jgi:hypothetical protein
VKKNLVTFLEKLKKKATNFGASNATIVDTDSKCGVGNPSYHQKHRSGFNSRWNSGRVDVGLLAGYWSLVSGRRLLVAGR